MPTAVAPSYAPSTDTRLFTTRFFVMCGFTFTVFLSAFQLLPAAPFRIRDLQGSTFASGLFLGFLTYASATSAPFTGALADRFGRRRTLLIASAVITLCTVGYAATSSYRVMLGLVVVHGIFWSALLTASAAYLTNLLPAQRRAEGIGYWGLSSVVAIAVAPPLAFWLLQRGWYWVCVSCGTLNALMGVIAWTLPDAHAPRRTVETGSLLEWRVLALAMSLFLYSFGYGAITSFSAVLADVIGVSPKSLYLTTLAVVIVLTRPFSGALADRIGYRRVFLPCLLLIAFGLTLLSLAGASAAGPAALAAGPATFITSAVLFGIGFGTAYPVFTAYVMRDVGSHRRAAAFGAIIAAFDTGIGTGSTVSGWLIQRVGFGTAFGTAAALSFLALPYFLAADRRLQ